MTVPGGIECKDISTQEINFSATVTSNCLCLEHDQDSGLATPASFVLSYGKPSEQ